MNKLALSGLVAVTILGAILAGCGGGGENFGSPAATGQVAGSTLSGSGSRQAPTDPPSNSAGTGQVTESTSSGSGSRRAITNPPSNCLKLRVTPQLNTPSAGCAPAHSAVTILRGPTSGDGYEWFEVSSRDGRGWVRGEYLVFN
jgi:hypothetical protein